MQTQSDHPTANASSHGRQTAMLGDDRDDEIHNGADGRRLAQITMDDKPYVPGERRNFQPYPNEVRAGVAHFYAR